MEKAGQEKCTQIDTHLTELSVKLEERHQRMTLLMRPIEDEADAEWTEVLYDYRKSRTEKELKNAELDRHIAFSGYIIDGSSEEEADSKVNDIIHSYKSHYNNFIPGKQVL